MTGTTASGWPYVEPDDHPKEWPAHSQALANKLEAADAWTVWTPAATNCVIKSADCRYQVTPGGLITLSMLVTITSMGTAPTLGMPPGLATAFSQPVSCALYSTGVNEWPGIAKVEGGQVWMFCHPTTAGASQRNIAAAAPFTWKTNDQIFISGTCRKA